MNVDALTCHHTVDISDCSFGEIPVEYTRGCNARGHTCMPYYDGSACCSGRPTESRKCVPCDETALARPDTSYEYTTLNWCYYKKILGKSKIHIKVIKL